MNEELNESIETTHDNDSASKKKKSGGILSVVKTGLSSVKNSVSDLAKSAHDSISKKMEASAQKKDLIKLFESKASTFLFWESQKAKTIQGIRNITTQTIQFLIRDKDFIRGNMELSVDGQCLIIQEFDLKDIIPFTSEDLPGSLESFKAYYKPKDRSATPSQSIVQTNNITVGDNFQGDINAVNQAKLLSDLDKIDTALKQAKPGFFNKGKLKEANDMFVNFKSSLLNNEKPKQSFIDKFISILQVVAPTAVSLVLGLV